MLYVFHVDTGTMLTFDMNLAMESVNKLQEIIAKTCRIPEDKQVLLISGGQSMSPTARVCSYSAGTDTNPIFLFSKNTIESATPPSGSVNYGAETELNEQVEGSMNIQPSYDAVVTRTQLALQFSDISKENLKLCERLVHDQHLQHQGWAAVIASLEDITSAFKTRWQGITERIESHLAKREQNITVLNSFPETVKLLSKIPLLGCLTPTFNLSVDETSATRGPDCTSAIDELPGPPSSPRQPRTLLDWISAQESKNTLAQMAQQCLDGLHQFDEKVRDGLYAEVENLLEAVNNPSMKEVKGLEDRLYGLEQLMYGAHKLVQEQADMSQGFVQNQNRAHNLQDMSVLPDLCNSHKRQLVVMLRNDQNLRDIHRRCMRAKDELSENLHTRLRWVMYVEKSICDIHGKLIIYNQRLKKLQHVLRLILQMHNAPDVYCSAVLEVVRRRAFADHFTEWSSGLCRDSKQIHDVEIEKRQMFSAVFKNHFLRTLFPGFDNKPPPFATKVPERFDDSLPPIKRDDVEFLKKEVPELTEKLSYPDDSGPPLEFPHLSFLDTQASSSRDSYSQTPHDFDDLPLDMPEVTSDGPIQAENRDEKLATSVEKTTGQKDGEKEEVDECDSEDTVVVEKESVLEAEREQATAGQDVTETTALTDSSKVCPKSEMKSGLSTVLEKSDLTVSQSVEVVGELDLCIEGPVKVLHHTIPPPAPSPSPLPSTVRGEMASRLEKRDSKSTGTSPDTDEEAASEGFTTADFYIDESMPSSLTESAGRKLAELQQVIQEKSYQLEHKERELEEHRRSLDLLNPRLNKARENFQLLHDVIHKGALQLRSDILGMEKQVQKDKDEYQSFMDSVTNNLVKTIAKFEEEQTSLRDSQVEALRDEHSTEIQQLQEKLNLEAEKQKVLKSEMDICNEKLKEKLEELEGLKQKMEEELKEIRQKHEEELNTVRNQMVLEQEVELEKVRSDLDLEVTGKDEELQGLNDKLDLKLREIEQLKLDKISGEEILIEKFQKEKEEIQAILGLEYEEKSKQTEEKLLRESKTLLEEDRQNLAREFKEKLNLEMIEIKTHIEDEKKRALCELQTELELSETENINDLKTKMLFEKETEIQCIRQKIEEEFEQKISAMREAFEIEREELKNIKLSETSRLEGELEKTCLLTKHVTETDALQTSTQLEPDKDYMSLSRHQVELEFARESCNKEKEETLMKLETELRAKHEAELTKLSEKLDQDRHDSLQEVQEMITAEKQVVFNEALNKVVAGHQVELEEREAEIANLQTELDKLKTKREIPKDTELEKSFHQEAERAPRSIQQDLETELARARQQMLQLESQLSAAGPLQLEGAGHQSVMGYSVMGQSVMPLNEAGTEGLVLTLQASLKNKEDEVTRLQSKIMDLSMSTSCRGLIQDKVSITSCNVGDLVLLCLDDQRANYVVFTVTNLLHFLHSEYLENLGLKTEDGQLLSSLSVILHPHNTEMDHKDEAKGPGEAKKSWVLAEVTDKEYCQAKKPHNRYNVPVGTKFYRIKARQWSREVALQHYTSSRQQSDEMASSQQQQQHDEPTRTQDAQSKPQEADPVVCDSPKSSEQPES